jgi:hypothetical protein
MAEMSVWTNKVFVERQIDKRTEMAQCTRCLWSRKAEFDMENMVVKTILFWMQYRA